MHQLHYFKSKFPNHFAFTLGLLVSVVAGAPPEVQRNRELGDAVASSPAPILLRNRAEFVGGWIPTFCLRINKLICIRPPLCVEP